MGSPRSASLLGKYRERVWLGRATVRQLSTEYCFKRGGKEWLMATFREEQAQPRRGWSRTRWLVLAAIAVAVVVAVVLLIVYSGGGSSGGGGGGY
jgi:uncharacterized membrane-anchored protein YitT (DUF2179 family)